VDNLKADEASEKMRNAMQDSGLTDSRFLARLLHTGVVLVNERAGLAFASPLACAILGATDEAELRHRWTDVAAQLAITGSHEQSRDGFIRFGRADIVTTAGTTPIRFELHALSHDGRIEQVLLLRERGRLLPSDRALLLAIEAETSRHALSGLVHGAKGPLNNFNLTLALLATSIERAGSGPIAPEARARWTRYLDVLRTETMRLTASLDEMNALATPSPREHETIDVGALLHDVVRVLHHDAAMREIDLEVDVPEAPVLVRGDRGLVRLALLAFTITILDHTVADGRFVCRVAATRGDGAATTISIAASHGVLQADLVDGLFRLACTAESEHAAAVTARMIIEAQGGNVAIANGASGPVGFRLQIPAAD
jgi:signal transduction histidine kinase